MRGVKHDDAPEMIAIVGMAGRFPEAGNLAAFWRNLCSGKASTSFFDEGEMLANGVDPAELEQPGYVKARAILEDAAWFDAGFFGYAPREAEILDPQQRVFLECAWETLEDAGYDPQLFAGAIGVFAGASISTYLINHLAPNGDLVRLTGEYQVMIGNDKDYLPTRVSYKLNLRGPSVNVQTACSSSLAAVALACQSLLDYQCDMALAGGVSIMFPQKRGYVHHEGGIFSPDGHCRAFDAQAQGTVPGQGVGIVALKRLEDALAAGDNIRAVIRGVAMNNDGSLKVGYTAPSVEGQAEVIAMAQAMADVEPASIGYIEAHGTGTPLGDPIEMAGLMEAFNLGRDQAGTIAIGSVKTNIGHLDAAAGIAGLIKSVLALENEAIPPSLHFERPNEKIDFADGPFYVNDRLRPWPRGAAPRRAGVSSFGIGGTNVHVVLEEAPVVERGAAPAEAWHILPLSARTPTALAQATGRLAAHLRATPELALADVAHTLQVGRRAFEHRRVVVGRTTTEAAEILEALTARAGAARQHAHAAQSLGAPNVVFLFPGQGAEYPGMGEDLYASEPEFRHWIDYCAAQLMAEVGFDIREVLYPARFGALGEAAAAERLRTTAVAQPVLFAVSYALARMWRTWGIEPAALLGHSVGELTAACVAGVFALEDALKLVAHRGRLMDRQEAMGAMLVVRLSAQALTPLLNGAISLAAINADKLTVASGPTAAIDTLQERLEQDGVQTQRLETAYAFHSELQASAVAPFRQIVAACSRRAPAIPIVSNVSGTWLTPEEAQSPDYWARHIRETVRFDDGLRTVLARPELVILEVGPGRTLHALTARHPQRTAAHHIYSSLPARRQTISAAAHSRLTLGAIWASGLQPQWPTVDGVRRASLPTYPFERQRFLVPAARQLAATAANRGRRPLTDWFYAPSWREGFLAPAPLGDGKRWLIFVDGSPLGDALVDRLRRSGADVVTVAPGPSFVKSDDHAFVVCPDCADDYQQLVEQLNADAMPDHIVHLWSLFPPDGHQSVSDPGRIQCLGFFSLLYLAQAFGRQLLPHALRLLVVTSELQSVTGTESIEPMRATVLGPARVIPREYPMLRCRTVDLGAAPARDAEWLAEQLIGECIVKGQEPLVAYRGRRRWVQAYEPVRMAGTADTKLTEHGVYLITGGLGGIGLTLAEWLAKRVRARLALLDVRALPPRQEWDRYLDAHLADDETAQTIRQILRMEANGSDVMVIRADVADAAQMRVALGRIKQTFGPMDGVIHAAGVPGEGMLQLKDPAGAEAVMRPKVAGTLVLSELVADEPLKFFILCSSITALVPTVGQGDYTAANAFLDAFAQQAAVMAAKRDRPITICTVNWDIWRDVGMAARTSVPLHLAQERAQILRHATSPDEGTRVFERILSFTGPQIVVSTLDLPERLAAGYRGANTVEPSPAWAGATSGADGSAGPGVIHHPRPRLEQIYVAPKTAEERFITSVWQKHLGVDKIGIYDNFFDLGGSSLLALNMTPDIERELGVKLPISLLLEVPTVAELAARVKGLAEASAAPRQRALVPLRTTGDKPPLFLIHGAGGEVMFYHELVRHLDPSQPVYALRATALDGDDSMLYTIEAMADRYLPEILSVQPEGPYLIGGYCGGGTIGYEIARRLQAQGKEVPLLALIETYNWDQMAASGLLDTVRFIAEKVRFHWRGWRMLDREARPAYLGERWQMLRIRVDSWLGRGLARLGIPVTEGMARRMQFGQLRAAHDAAALSYKPVPIETRVLHIVPTLQHKRDQASAVGWETLAQDGVQRVTVRSAPTASVIEPFVQETAGYLVNAIDESLAAHTKVHKPT